MQDVDKLSILLILLYFTSLLFYGESGALQDASLLMSGWQFIDLSLLENNLLKSIWYDHAQPPLFNAIIGLIIKLFPTDFVVILFTLNQILFLLSVIIICSSIIKWGFSWATSLIVGIVLMFSPHYMMYRWQLFYDLPTAFILTLIAIIWICSVRNQSFKLFVGILILLIALAWSRSIFHPLFISALTFLLFLQFYSTLRKKALTLCLLNLILIWLPVVKNGILFSSWSTSSWLGMNMFRVTFYHVDTKDIEQWIQQGRIHKICAFSSFEEWNTYSQLFHNQQQVNHIAMLDSIEKSNGYKNLRYTGYIQVSKSYLQGAKYLITNHPLIYFKAILKGIGKFFCPVDESLYFDQQRLQFKTIVMVGHLLLLQPKAVFSLFDVESGDRPYLKISILWLIMGFAWLYWILFKVRISIILKRENIPLLAITSIIGWIFLMGNALEFGENMRFRFLIMPIWVLLSLALYRIYQNQKKTISANQ